MKKVHDDPATKAIWWAVCKKCAEEGIVTIFEWAGQKIFSSTAKTAENRFANGVFYLDEIEKAILLTNCDAEIRKGVAERLTPKREF